MSWQYPPVSWNSIINCNILQGKISHFPMFWFLRLVLQLFYMYILIFYSYLLLNHEESQGQFSFSWKHSFFKNLAAVFFDLLPCWTTNIPSLMPQYAHYECFFFFSSPFSVRDKSEKLAFSEDNSQFLNIVLIVSDSALEMLYLPT